MVVGMKGILVGVVLNKWYFQSSNRDTDLTLVQGLYREGIALKNDFVGPTGVFNFRFLSSSPQQIPNYWTLVNPYDGFVWAFLLASVVAVIFSLIIIDTFYADWTKTSKKDIIYQSKYWYLLVLSRNILRWNNPF